MMRCGSSGCSGSPASARADAVRAEIGEHVDLLVARRRRARVGEVDDHALSRPVDGGVRRVDETGQALRQPVIAPRLLGVAVHALLHDDPMAVVGDDEAVQVEIEPVLHRRAIDFGDQPAGLGQRIAIEADAAADLDQFARRLARMRAAPAADMQAEFPRARREAALQGAEHARL